MDFSPLLILLGVAAGLITTITGLGGGMLLVSALALVWDPLSALTVTSFALLIGNAQRVYMFRRHVDRAVATRLVAGAVPGSIAGALVATSLPPLVLHLAIVAITALAVVRTASSTAWRFPINGLTPAAAGVGALAAMSGGGGFLLGPIMLSAGLSGTRYVATAATTAVFIHIGRTTGYAINGMVGTHTLIAGAGLAVCIVAGNLIGRQLRRTLPARSLRGFEYGTPVVVAFVALAGLLA